MRLVSAIEINGYVTGALQVFCDGQWGAVCSSNFDSSDALVACRQLGFATGVVPPTSARPLQRRFAAADDPVRCLALGCMHCMAALRRTRTYSCTQGCPEIMHVRCADNDQAHHQSNAPNHEVNRQKLQLLITSSVPVSSFCRVPFVYLILLCRLHRIHGLELELTDLPTGISYLHSTRMTFDGAHCSEHVPTSIQSICDAHDALCCCIPWRSRASVAFSVANIIL